MRVCFQSVGQWAPKPQTQAFPQFSGQNQPGQPAEGPPSPQQLSRRDTMLGLLAAALGINGLFTWVTQRRVGRLEAENRQLAQEVSRLRWRSILPEVIAETTLKTNTVKGNTAHTTTGTGSGVWVKHPTTGKLFVLTAYHVVDKPEVDGTENRVKGKRPKKVKHPILYTVSPYDSFSSYRLKPIHHRADWDLALMAVEVEAWDGALRRVVPITLRDFGAEAPVVGEPVFSVGAPKEFQDTVMVGAVSHLNRTAEINGRRIPTLQTDAGVIPGNSGGGLFDAKGRLVGINVAAVESKLGFTVPASKVAEFLTEAFAKVPT